MTGVGPLRWLRDYAGSSSEVPIAPWHLTFDGVKALCGERFVGRRRIFQHLHEGPLDDRCYACLARARRDLGLG